MADVAQVGMVNRALGLLGQEPVADLTPQSLQYSSAAVKLLRVIHEARDVVLARHGWTCALEYVTLHPTVIPNYVNWRYPSTYLLPGNALRVWEIEGMRSSGSGLGGWEPRWQVGTTEANGASQLIIRAAPPVGPDPLGFGGWGVEGWGGGYSSRPSATSANGPMTGCPTPQPTPVQTGCGQPCSCGDGCECVGGGAPCPQTAGCAPSGVGPLHVAYVRRAAWESLDPHVRDAVATELAARGCYSITGDMAKQQALEKQAEDKVLLAISTEGNQEGGQPPLAPSIPAMLRRLCR